MIRYLLSAIIRLIFKFIILVTISGLILFLAPGIPPDFEFDSYSLKPPTTIKINTTEFILDKAEIYIKDEIVVPESIAIRGNVIFTGDGRGRVYKIKSPNNIQMIAQYGYECPYTSPAHKRYNERRQQLQCSYPLAFRFAPNGKLFFTDPMKGVLTIDPVTGVTEVIVDMSEPIDGKRPLVPEDLDITKDGTIYWTDGSTVSPMGNFPVDGFIKPSGRLLRFDPVSNKSNVLLYNIHFSNGVQLSADESFVLVADTFRRKITRYFINGPKQGTSDIFFDNLPGYPDNIRSNGKGGFYIALVSPRNENYQWITETLSEYPLIKRFIVRIRHLLREMILMAIELGIDEAIAKELFDYVGSFGSAFDFKQLPKVGLILEIDGEGKPVKLLQSSKEMAGISQFTIGPEYAYTSSPLGNEIWRIKLSDL